MVPQSSMKHQSDIQIQSRGLKEESQPKMDMIADSTKASKKKSNKKRKNQQYEEEKKIGNNSTENIQQILDDDDLLLQRYL